MANPVTKPLATLLALGAIALQTGCGKTKTAAFKTRDEASKACYEHLEKEIKNEIRGTSDYRKDNFTSVKNDDEQYLIFDYACKPSFKKGDTVGELIPIYFYLDEYGETQWKWAMNWDGDDFIEYTYLLGKKIDFDSRGFPDDESKMSWFAEPFNMPFTSIKSDALVTGIGFGSVLRLCRSSYWERDITEEEAEIRFEKDKKFVLRTVNNEEEYLLPYGPTSEKAKEKVLAVM